MAQLVSFAVPGNLGNIEGAGADGVLLGKMTATNPTKALLKGTATTGLCYTDDGGTYVDESTALAEATADDVEVFPATPADDDAVYFGHATLKFSRVDLNVTTTGVGTWTVDWQYWNGTEWTALADITDGTEAFVGEGTGWKSVVLDAIPADWTKCLVDNVNAYWIRAVVDDYQAVTTPPQVGQGYFITETPVWTNDLTDFTDADAGDVALLPAYPAEGDGFYIGYSAKFCKVKITTSQAMTGTATIALKYWNGSAWAAVTVVDDDSAGYTANAGTHYIHFVPPTDWVANTAGNGPNGQTGFFVCLELTELTEVTQAPLATQGWVYPLATGATGTPAPVLGTVSKVTCNAGTLSAANADSKFLLVNATQGTCASFTWTKATAIVSATVSLSVAANDQLLLVQVTEDGSTEFADTNFHVLI